MPISASRGGASLRSQTPPSHSSCRSLFSLELRSSESSQCGPGFTSRAVCFCFPCCRPFGCCTSCGWRRRNLHPSAAFGGPADSCRSSLWGFPFTARGFLFSLLVGVPFLRRGGRGGSARLLVAASRSGLCCAPRAASHDRVSSV